MLVNRYELANKDVRALVYYWYQGRGRVASSEYAVKWDLLRDAALTGRTEEALVRIVIPLNDDRITQPDSLAQQIARTMMPQVAAILPAGE
jgi:EpsI family protein